MRRRTFVATSLAAAGTGLLPRAQAAEIRALDVIAPAAPGGGWDQTARAIQNVLRAAGIAGRVQVTNIPGAGGTIGLARFVSSNKGRADTLMVTGLIMEGAILANKSEVTLSATTPIARLTGEYEAIAVTTNSPIKTMADLAAMLRKDPGAVSWGGGSAGGTDHILAGLVTKAAGGDPKKISYVAHSGGGEAIGSILGGHVTVGVNSYSELAGQIKTGRLRPLAISSAARVPDIDMPTLREAGLDVVLINWRGVVAAPGLSDADRDALSNVVAKMVASDQWKATLAQREWLDMYQPAAEFDAFMREDRVKITAILKEIGLVAA